MSRELSSSVALQLDNVVPYLEVQTCEINLQDQIQSWRVYTLRSYIFLFQNYSLFKHQCVTQTRLRQRLRVLSGDWKVGGLSPDSNCPHVKVSVRTLYCLNVKYKRHGTRRRKRWVCWMRMKTHWRRIWAVLCLFSLWVGVRTACVQSVCLCQSHTLPCLCHVCCPGSQFLHIYFLVFSTSCFLFSGCLCALLIASPTRLCLPFLHVWLAPPDSNALLLCPRSSSPVHYTFQNKAKYTQHRHTPCIIN